ncbi:hypothetical protein V7127_25645 [Bacillus sp. JJ1773]|uniref:hypothetical protein n=1 Tax=Bacillus sp. JJ1773 TaxID=3122965 RepID=UPI002FFD9CDC
MIHHYAKQDCLTEERQILNGGMLNGKLLNRAVYRFYQHFQNFGDEIEEFSLQNTTRLPQEIQKIIVYRKDYGSYNQLNIHTLIIVWV